MVDTIVEWDKNGYTIKVIELDNHPGKIVITYPWNWHN